MQLALIWFYQKTNGIQMFEQLFELFYIVNCVLKVFFVYLDASRISHAFIFKLSENKRATVAKKLKEKILI